jgi:hypothetical protein
MCPGLKYMVKTYYLDIKLMFRFLPKAKRDAFGQRRYGPSPAVDPDRFSLSLLDIGSYFAYFKKQSFAPPLADRDRFQRRTEMDEKPTPEARTSRLAIAAFICALVCFLVPMLSLIGILTFPVRYLSDVMVLGALLSAVCFLGAIVALVLGIVAMRRIKRSEGRLKAGWAAKAATALGFFCLPLVILGIPNAIESRRDEMRAEAPVIGNLRIIHTAQLLYREGDRDANKIKDYAPHIGTLSRYELIDPILGSGTKQGYVFSVSRSKSSPDFQWNCTARPEPGESHRYFYIDETGVLRYETNKMPGPKSPAIGR